MSTTVSFKTVPSPSEVIIRNGCLYLEEEVRITEPELVEHLGTSIVEVLLDPEISKGKLVGSVFMVAIDHLASLLCNEKPQQEPLAPGNGPGHTNRSSALLQLENVVNVDSLSSTLVLYVAASLCENMGEKILTEVDNVSLLQCLTTIIKCHAVDVVKRKETVVLSRSSETTGLVGGCITLSIAFGLLSAFMTANKEVWEWQ